MGLTGVNHVTLCVADLDRALAFYRDVLGGVPRAIWPRGAYLELGALWLCLELSDNVTPRRDDSHVALSATPGDFAAMAARISAHARIWKDNRSAGASVYFVDPDGHKLELHDGDLASRLAQYRAQGRADMILLP
ncbi:VOC family protein [Oceaniglobus indicus]|uniref:VOC family protein n=1 Tax=Oceaniglobus indicus TaxID=2047749 RepID=UPI000C197135|nr:VOC family protein [Oceaniglobus indicus]